MDLNFVYLGERLVCNGEERETNTCNEVFICLLRMNEFHSKSMFISPICKSNKVSPSTQLTQLAIIELYSNRFIIFIIQIIYNTKNKTFLIL